MLRVFHLSDFHLTTGLLNPGFLDACSELGYSLVEGIGFYQQADLEVRNKLPMELDFIGFENPTSDVCYVVSGDIATLPYRPQVIDGFHRFLRGTMPGSPGNRIGLAIPRSSLVPVTGNHDVCTKGGRTNYRASFFEQEYGVSRDTVRCLIAGDIICVFFLLRTAISILLPWGSISATQIDWLRSKIQALEHGNQVMTDDGKKINREQYHQALKFLVLHHSPLEQDQYPSMGTFNYKIKQLRGRDELLDLCRSKIDVILFGHTHTGLVACNNGTVFVDSGTCMATLGGVIGHIFPYPTIFSFHTITISDDHGLQVTQYLWRPGEKKFTPEPSRFFARNPGSYHEVTSPVHT